MIRDKVLTAMGGSVAIVTDAEGILCQLTSSVAPRELRTDDTPASSSSSTYSPEQVRILNGVDRPDNTIDSHNLVIQLVKSNRDV